MKICGSEDSYVDIIFSDVVGIYVVGEVWVGSGGVGWYDGRVVGAEVVIGADGVF